MFLASRGFHSLAALALILGLSGLGCAEAEQAPAAAAAPSTPALLVDQALLAELLGEAAEVAGDDISADGLLVRLAFEPLIRGTGPASLQLVQSQGYRLTGVAERGPLWQLGLRDGDVLTMVDGQPITGREHELRSWWEGRPSHAELTYLRGDETRALKLRVQSGAAWKRSDSDSRADKIAGRSAALERQTEGSSDTPETVADLRQSLRCAPSEFADEGAIEHIGRCELRRDGLDQLLANPDLLARQMRIVPSVSDGKTGGFKLFSIRRESIPSMIGLKNGDTIQAINDAPLTSVDAALETYTKLRDADELDITFERMGKTHLLQLAFVDVLSGPPATFAD